MGREVRRVPRGWEHPKDEHGSFTPLFGRSFAKAVSEWDEGKRRWDAGFVSDFHGGWETLAFANVQSESYEEWDGHRPVESDYMPDWSESERTHWQMYETCTEGTPISPVMETPEELARWLAENGASAFADATATYEHWLAMIVRGWSPSGVVIPGKGLVSGVEGLSS